MVAGGGDHHPMGAAHRLEEFVARRMAAGVMRVVNGQTGQKVAAEVRRARAPRFFSAARKASVKARSLLEDPGPGTVPAQSHDQGRGPTAGFSRGRGAGR